MGLGSFAASSSSNLSPLAPPFTVERSKQLNFTSNRGDSHLSDGNGTPSFTSPIWPQFHSARQAGLLADSIRTATIPSATTYNWDSINSVVKSGLEPINPNPQPGPSPQLSAVNPNNPQLPVDSSSSSSYNRTEPFYYPCVSWSSDEDDAPPLAPLNEEFLHNRGLFHGCGASQVDYSQNLAGLKYNAPQVGAWGGLADGSRGKNLDSEHSFFSEEANLAGSRNYMNQVGAYDVETLSRGKEDSAMFPGRHSNLVREKNVGSLIIGKSHGASFSGVNQGLVSNGFSKEHSFTAFSEFSESHPLVPSPEPKEPWNSHSSYTPYGTRSLFDSYSNPKPPSITKSLPSVVIKPPVALSTFSAQSAVSTKSTEVSSNAAFNNNDVLVGHNPLKQKESHLPLGFEAKGSSVSLNQLSFQIGRTDDHHAFVDSSTMRDASNKMSTDEQLDYKFKSMSNFQFPEVKVTKDGKSTANLPEHIDHHNPAEDSPCWKGAPTHFSPFGFPETEPPQHPMKKLHESSVPNERILASTPTQKDLKSGGAVVVGFGSAEASKGQAQSSCDVAKPRNEYSFLSETSGDANSQASKLKLSNLNEDVPLSGVRIRSTDGIVEHSMHASSIEDAANLASAESLDVNVIVKALQNLSELLLLHCSKDECGLKEQDHNALHQIVSNLNVCMSRKIQQVPPTQNYTLPQHISSNVLQEGAYVGKSPVTNVTTGTVHDQVGSLSAVHLESKSENIEKLQGASLRDIDLQKDHNMVQTIKKVLDENLDCTEDLPSHNLLYKNLWLEAEAELCALSYRARFHRVKREMAKSEASDVSEVGSDIKKISSSNFSPIAPKLIHEAAGSKESNNPAHNPSLSNVDGNIDDVESSVMARFNILKRRGESKPGNMAEKESVDVEVSGNEVQSSGASEGPHLQHDVGKDDAVAMHSHGNQKMQHSQALVMARLNVLKSRGELVPVNVEWQVLADGAHFQHQAGKDDAVVMHSHGNQKMQHPLALGTEDVENSVMARLNLLKSRGELDPVNVEWQVLADGAHFQHQAGKEDGVGIGPGGTRLMQNRFESGLHSASYNASSDWEHVLKDEFS